MVVFGSFGSPPISSQSTRIGACLLRVLERILRMGCFVIIVSLRHKQDAQYLGLLAWQYTAHTKRSNLKHFPVFWHKIGARTVCYKQTGEKVLRCTLSMRLACFCKVHLVIRVGFGIVVFDPKYLHKIVGFLGITLVPKCWARISSPFARCRGVRK